MPPVTTKMIKKFIENSDGNDNCCFPDSKTRKLSFKRGD